MRKAFSAENIASFAQSTFGSLRRFIVPNGEEVSDLASYTRAVEDRCLRGYALDSRVSTWAQLLEQEIATALCPQGMPGLRCGDEPHLKEEEDHSDPHTLPPMPMETSSPTTEATADYAAPPILPPHRGPSAFGGMAAAAARGGVATPRTPTMAERIPHNTPNTRRKAPSEQALLAALECCRLVTRTYGDDAITVFREVRLLPTMLVCLESAACSKKLVEAVQVFLLDALGGAPTSCLGDVAEDVVALVSLICPPLHGLGLLGESASLSGSSSSSALPLIPSNQFLVPKLRTLLVVYASLKRADINCIASCNEIKSSLVQAGMLDSLVRIASRMRDLYKSAAGSATDSKGLHGKLLGIVPTSSLSASKAFGTPSLSPANAALVHVDASPSLLLSVGIAAMGVMGGLIRSNVPNKQELVDQHPIFFELWSFYAGLVNRLDAAHAFVPTVEVSELASALTASTSATPRLSSSTSALGAAAGASSLASNPVPHTSQSPPPSSKNLFTGEEQVIVCDSAPHWAPELAEVLIELSTSDSFALTRQSLLREVVTEAQAPFLSNASAASDETLNRWEQLPGDWDVLVSAGSVLVWRMTSAVPSCSLSATSARHLLDALRNLDLSSRGTDYVFRATLACLIILCRASPINMDAVAEADGLRMLVSMMVNKRSSVLTFEDEFGGLPKASVSYGRPSWEICRALLALLMYTSPHCHEVRTLMSAIDAMLTKPTCVEDCEIIEFCLQTIGCGTYPKRVLWMTSSEAKVVCPVDRFAGRWYGYTFVAWINPLCIWSVGSHLFAYGEPSTPSAVVLVIVANGKSKCLALKSIAGSETLMTMLEGTTLWEGWNHVAVVHNISGYVVWVNGKRRCAPTTSVPFPKEPSKPHKLTFSFGGGAQGSGVLPFLGMMTTPQLIDGSIADRDIERLFQAGAGSTVQSVDPPIALQPFLEIDSPSTPAVLSTNTSVVGPTPRLGPEIANASVDRLSLQDAPPSSASNRAPSPIEGGLAESVRSAPSSPNRGSSLLPPPPQQQQALVRRSSSYKPEDDPFNRRVLGLLAKPRDAEIESVFFTELPRVSELLVNENVIGWFRTVIGAMDDSSNSHSVAILCVEMLTVYARQVRDGVQSIYASGVLDDLRSVLLSWEHIPMQVIPIVLELTLPPLGARTLANHPLSTQVLQLVVDIAAQDRCPASTRSCAFKELSALLSFNDNLRLFRNGPRLESLLALCTSIPIECTDDFVVLVEKVVKDTPEMTQLFHFLVHESEGPSSASSPLLPGASSEVYASFPGVTSPSAVSRSGRVVPTIKCSILRMIYDVSKSNPTLIDMLGSVNAVQQLLVICHCTTSEVTRVYAIRLLALILHASKRQKEAFVRSNGFETLCTVLSESSGVPLGIPTFNCLFKFALDFFQVTTSEASNNVMSRLRAFQGASSAPSAPPVNKPTAAPTATQRLDGHLPSLIPESNRRTMSMDMSSLCSGDTAGDIESRLNIDDSYSNHTRGGMVHPQLLQTIFHLLNVVLKDIRSTYRVPTPEVSARPELERQATNPQGSDGGSETPSTSATSSRQSDDYIVAKVMDYVGKVFDVNVNSEAVVAFPWLDWVWSGVADVYQHSSHYPRSTYTVVDKGVRNILRKIVLADLHRGKSVTQIKKVKEYADLPQLQQIVLEEVTRYFAAGNRLDALKQEDATNVIRNLDTLLLGIDECISPFPLSIGIEVINAVRSMTVNSNTWVRGRIRNSSRLMETRDRLAFLLLTSLDHLHGERRDYLTKVVDANLHDPSSALVLLRLIVDAYDKKSAERMEVVQSMLGEFIDKDGAFSKTILRTIANDADFLNVLHKGSSDELLAWCMANEAQWKTISLSIIKASKPIETEVSARHEKREKEIGNRKKLRKVEVDRRIALQRKAATDFDRVKSELEAKQVAYDNAMSSKRKELAHCGMSGNTTPPLSIHPPPTMASSPKSPPRSPAKNRGPLE